MRISLIMALCALLMHGADSFDTWFKEGSVSGNLRYYYIETNKDFITGEQTSAHSNAVGGQLKYATSKWKGLKLGTTFMTTQSFLLPEHVESSTIGQDNGRRGDDPSKSYSVLGEVYADYSNDRVALWYGRRVITTPMLGAKDVRMLPSAVQGAQGTLFINKEMTLSFTHIQGFKQRSSNEFTNIIEHALGSDTRSVTGSDSGNAISITFDFKDEHLTFKFYDLYASDFINTLYADLAYSKDFYTISAQAVSQISIGNADVNLAKPSSVTNGKKINTAGLGVRAELSYKESSFDLVYRTIFRDSSAYDSIITPWDGTLLYSYSSTTNNLGQSLYGKGLSAGGAYVGGTQGIKIGYTQKYDHLFKKGFKTHIAYARYHNPRYREDQEDLKAILSYTIGTVSLQLKGIWIDNDTYTFKDGTVNQLDSLTQFHAIANFTF